MFRGATAGVCRESLDRYLGHLANYNVLYGSVAAGIVLLVWMYLLAVIALLGCEFNAERERLG